MRTRTLWLISKNQTLVMLEKQSADSLKVSVHRYEWKRGGTWFLLESTWEVVIGPG